MILEEQWRKYSLFYFLDRLIINWVFINHFIYRLLNRWHIFVINSLSHNLHTSYMHYLRHILEALHQLCPAHSYSTCPFEYIIGLYSQLIKSKSSPTTNAGNIMVRLSAIHEYKKQKNDQHSSSLAIMTTTTDLHTKSAVISSDDMTTIMSYIMNDEDFDENAHRNVYALSKQQILPELMRVLDIEHEFEDMIFRENRIIGFKGLL